MASIIRPEIDASALPHVNAGNDSNYRDADGLVIPADWMAHLANRRVAVVRTATR